MSFQKFQIKLSLSQFQGEVDQLTETLVSCRLEDCYSTTVEINGETSPVYVSTLHSSALKAALPSAH